MLYDHEQLKTDSAVRFFNVKTIKYLEEYLPFAHGTILYVKILTDFFDAYQSENIEPLERIFLAWRCLVIFRIY